MTAEYIADEGDIADNELRHCMQLLALQQVTAAGIALHPVLAVVAFDAPTASEALVVAALQPAVGQFRMTCKCLFDVFHRQRLWRIQIPTFAEQAGRGFIAFFVKFRNFADAFGKRHGNTVAEMRLRGRISNALIAPRFRPPQKCLQMPSKCPPLSHWPTQRPHRHPIDRQGKSATAYRSRNHLVMIILQPSSIGKPAWKVIEPKRLKKVRFWRKADIG